MSHGGEARIVRKIGSGIWSTSDNGFLHHHILPFSQFNSKNHPLACVVNMILHRLLHSNQARGLNGGGGEGGHLINSGFCHYHHAFNIEHDDISLGLHLDHGFCLV